MSLILVQFWKGLHRWITEMKNQRRENDFVASTKRFVNIASENQCCCSDNLNRYNNNNVKCYHNSYHYRGNN